MVIVPPTGRVNRTSPIAISRCAAGTSAIPCSAAPCARLHPVYREP
jgi:hypothetical protein